MSTEGAPRWNDWRESAACRGHSPGEFFTPVGTELRSERLDREREAKRLCWSCSVRGNCLSHALRTGEQYGIWGGLTFAERRRLAQRERPSKDRYSPGQARTA